MPTSCQRAGVALQESQQGLQSGRSDDTKQLAPGVVLMERPVSAVACSDARSDEAPAQFQAADWSLPSDLHLGDDTASAEVPLIPLTRYSSADYCSSSTVQTSVLFPHGSQKTRQRM